MNARFYIVTHYKNKSKPSCLHFSFLDSPICCLCFKVSRSFFFRQKWSKKLLKILYCGQKNEPFDSIFICWFVLFRNIRAEFLQDNNLLIECVLDHDTDLKDKVDLTEVCIVSNVLKGNLSWLHKFNSGLQFYFGNAKIWKCQATFLGLHVPLGKDCGCDGFVLVGWFVLFFF